MATPRVLLCGIGMAAGLGVLVTSPAWAASTQSCGDVGCPAPVLPAEPLAGPASSAATAATTSQSQGSGLAFTGADIAETTVFAFAALGLGTALVYGSRRSRRGARPGA